MLPSWAFVFWDSVRFFEARCSRSIAGLARPLLCSGMSWPFLAAVAVGTGQLWPVRKLSAPGYPEKDMERVLREACCSNSRAKTCSIWSLTRILPVPLNTKTPHETDRVGTERVPDAFYFPFLHLSRCLGKLSNPLFPSLHMAFFMAGKTCITRITLVHYKSLHACANDIHKPTPCRTSRTFHTHTHTCLPLESKNFLVDFLVERVTPADWSDSKGLARLAWHQNLKWYKPCYAARAWRHRQLKKRG